MECFYLWTMLQIILESLPVSSSGHLQLFEYFCSGTYAFFAYDQLRSYVAYFLHIPTALVVTIYFYRDWSLPFKYIRRDWRLVLRTSLYVAVADTITVCGYVLKDSMRYQVPLAIGFAVTAVCLLSLRWCVGFKPARWSLKKAVLLGCLQSVAFTPGVSRLGITYAALCWMHIVPRRAFQIAWLIHWPLMIVAGLYSVHALSPLHELLSLPFLLVMLGAGIIAYFGLCGIEYMVNHSLMWLWGFYMLVPLLISLLGEM